MGKSFLFSLLLLPVGVFAQTPVATIEVDNVQSAYVDRPGDLYVLLKNNKLKKFDIEGKLLSEQVFSDTPTLFDPRDGSRAFVYCSKTQQCSFYSEEIKQSYAIEQQYAVEPFLVCSSGDQQLWIVDRSDWSLKRVMPSQSKVMIEAPIDQKQFSKAPDITGLREYQNFLFILEKNTGILIFNSIGKQIKKIPGADIEYMNFLGEELYYKKGDKLYFYDLFDASTREMAIDSTCKYYLLTDARKFLVYENKIEILKNN